MNKENTGEFMLKRKPQKFTWFREDISKRGTKLVNIDTLQQLGYFFTEVLPKETF